MRRGERKVLLSKKSIGGRPIHQYLSRSSTSHLHYLTRLWVANWELPENQQKNWIGVQKQLVLRVCFYFHFRDYHSNHPVISFSWKKLFVIKVNWYSDFECGDQPIFSTESHFFLLRYFWPLFWNFLIYIFDGDLAICSCAHGILHLYNMYVYICVFEH